jgi:uncharacterized protein (TIGR04255 family)
MPESEHLRNAPIVEALLDIQVTLPPKTIPENLDALQRKLGGRYPTKQIRKNFQGELSFSADATPVAKTSERFGGYQFGTADGKEVMQARMDGYSFSRLQPYTNWDQFSSLAREGWREYAKLFKPVSVNRIALRYINRIPLPMPFSDFTEYVLTAPRIAPTLSLNLKQFFFRAITQDDKAKATVVITETVEETTTSSLHVPLIFDIDVFRLGAFPKEAEKLWPLFSPLHDLKNRVFFESVTPATLELFA